MPHICPVLADVGFHGCPPITLYQQQILSMAIYALHSQGLRFVESHICQNRADMGHPGFVADRAPEKSRLKSECENERFCNQTPQGPEGRPPKVSPVRKGIHHDDDERRRRGTFLLDDAMHNRARVPMCLWKTLVIKATGINLQNRAFPLLLAGALILVGAGDLIQKQTQVAAQNNVRSELGRGRRLYTLNQKSNECLQGDLALREWPLVDRG